MALQFSKRGVIVAKRKGIDQVETAILLEHSRLTREKSHQVLDKSLLMYFSFIILGVVGFITGYIDAKFLNTMVLLGFGVLLIGFASYIITMHKEEKRLNNLLHRHRTGGNK